MQVIAFFMAMLAAMHHFCVGSTSIGSNSVSQKVKMWKRATTSPPHSPTHSSSSVEVYSPVRTTGHMYQDAYYEPFASHHDPTRWTPPPSSPIPDKPESPIKIVAVETNSKPRRRYTEKASKVSPFGNQKL